MKRTTYLLISTAAALLFVLGCGDTAENNAPGEVIKSDKQRLVTPTVDQGDSTKQVDGNRAFTFDLYQQVSAETGNLFFSPHSISLALAMLHGGARNATETQLAQALHYDLPQSKLHNVFNWLDLELNSRGQGKKAADGGKFRLNVVNASWGQKGYSFLPAYLDLLGLNYGAGMRVLDFQSNPDPSRKTINSWVEQETENRIKDLLPEGSINSLTRLLLTNAIYFNAAWAEPFKPENTADEKFNLLDGTQVTTKMMSHGFTTGYVTGSDYQAMSLPYDGHELSMLVIVPDKGKFNTFEKTLDSNLLDTIEKGLSSHALSLKLPRFEVTKKLDLIKTLKALGVVDAFDSAKADFSGISGKKDLYVTGVFHKAFVKVNEAGTEAAAATGVVVGASSAPPPATLIADRPFIFLILDHKTRQVLFVGRVLDPTA